MQESRRCAPSTSAVERRGGATPRSAAAAATWMAQAVLPLTVLLPSFAAAESNVPNKVGTIMKFMVWVLSRI